MKQLINAIKKVFSPHPTKHERDTESVRALKVRQEFSQAQQRLSETMNGQRNPFPSVGD